MSGFPKRVATARGADIMVPYRGEISEERHGSLNPTDLVGNERASSRIIWANLHRKVSRVPGGEIDVELQRQTPRRTTAWDALTHVGDGGKSGPVHVERPVSLAPPAGRDPDGATAGAGRCSGRSASSSALGQSARAPARVFTAPDEWWLMHAETENSETLMVIGD
ncbi:hypothetical protein SETIT_1G296300v2 [Setaria italica]|uniref:Uncharacterized protein n=1 Tax=Setaria italica TaxID=4555 RepID=A0A368PQY4_SETIT|nr:hypothetical protein SETIT_1G296300v2 [Setaria italica]